MVKAAVDASLLDVVDNVLNHGVVLHGDLTLGLADIDLIYARLSLLLAAADKVDDGRLRIASPRPRRRRVSREVARQSGVGRGTR